MDLVPEDCADKTEEVSANERYRDERDRRLEIKGFNHIDRLNHVRPKAEIDEQLSPADQNQQRSNRMPSVNQPSDHETDLVWISHLLYRLKGSKVLR